MNIPSKIPGFNVKEVRKHGDFPDEWAIEDQGSIKIVFEEEVPHTPIRRELRNKCGSGLF
jgi:hypothetical protein